MALPKNRELTANARQLRKNMTKEEHQLWQYCLRNAPVKFYRQRVVGNYILDFYCSSFEYRHYAEIRVRKRSYF